MNITQVAIPEWNGTNGNWKKGRLYYNGPNIGKQATVNKIICHWSDNAAITVTDNVFKDPNRVNSQGAPLNASAHYAVQDSTVHQYVQLGDTSFNCGVGTANCESVAIEFTGMPGIPISDLTYQTGWQLITEVICPYFGWTPSRSLLHPHSEFIATECPGTLNLDHLASIPVISMQGVDQPVNGAPAQTTSFQVPILLDVVRFPPNGYPQTSIREPVNVRTRVDRLDAADVVEVLRPGIGDGGVVIPLLEDVESVVRGVSVNGNDQYFRKPNGLYFWTGVTDFNGKLY